MGYKDNIKDLYVYRNPVKVSEVLLSKNLCCYPPENEAAKLFVKFLDEHPEYSSEDINIRIDEEEREEDHYGNRGGVDSIAVIFKLREETEKEYFDRIREKENELIDAYSKDIADDVYNLLGKLNILTISDIDRKEILGRLYRRIADDILKQIDKYEKV